MSQEITTPMKLLLLEDNRELAASLGEYLEAKNCCVDYTHSGKACIALIKSNQYDILILDIAMRGMDGLQVCREIRQQLQVSTPIIFLTARDTLEDKLIGFESGGDDYLVKPFAPQELLYRLKSLFLRGPRRDIGIQSIGEIVIDYSRETVTRQGCIIPLQKTQFQIFKLLLKNSPDLVTKEILELELWGDDMPQSDALRTHIYRLRNLMDKPFDRAIIKTIHARGYRLEI
jgi:DNA-binding response OmpR family regulator